MKFSRAESCRVAFGFVTVCGRVLECPVTGSRLASVRLARWGCLDGFPAFLLAGLAGIRYVIASAADFEWWEAAWSFHLHVAGLSHMSAAAILSVVGIRFRAGSSHLTIRNCRSFRQAVANRQLTGGKLWDMAKKTAASEPQERPYKTTGVHLPADLWELLNRVAFERARTRGGRASVSALLTAMIERHRKELELELGKTVR